jgi:hypothetical protein
MRRLSVVLCVFAVALAVGPSPAPAAPIASFATQGCPLDTPQWRILYRLYWTDSSGRQLDRGALPEVLSEANEFAQRTGQLSDCAVRIQIDIDDQGSAVWTGGEPFGGSAQQAIGYPETPKAYDASFARIPAEVGGGAITDPRKRSAIFPVTVDDGGAPWSMLLMHEWLHAVVEFYTGVAWPKEDVHGGCLRMDYRAREPSTGCMVLAGWFSDLMTGRVIEDGVAKGITKETWAYQGTPTRPLHLDPEFELHGPGRVDTLGKLTLTGRAYRGPLTVIYRGHAGQELARQTVVFTGETEFRAPKVPPGHILVCVQSPETELARAYDSCPLSLDNIPRDPFRGRRLSGGRIQFAVVEPYIGRKATVVVRWSHMSSPGRYHDKTIRRAVTLKRRMVVKAPRPFPPGPNTHGPSVQVIVPPFTVNGAEVYRTVIDVVLR